MKKDISSLIAEYRSHFALSAEFYCSPQVFQMDLEKIFYRSWIYAGHISQLPENGCYFLMEFGNESIIMVRDGQGKVHAFANVCRHRGSRVCVESRGKVRAFVCPYHAWTYELDGRLRSRRAMPNDFDQTQYGLKRVSVALFHGLLFIHLNKNAPDFNESVFAVSSSYEIYGLENAKIAYQETYSVDANWKLAIENFMECYHCAPAHSEYSRCHALKSPKDNKALLPNMLAKATNLGYQTKSIDNSSPTDNEDVQYYYARNALYEPYVTGSRNGEPVAPLLGKVKGYDGGVADIQLGPALFGILYADHAVLYRFLPKDVQNTDMDVIWLVDGDAEQGRDYDLDNLTWMWNVTTKADKHIILNNQKGVNSRFYEPGPLSEMETFTADFIQWYLARIR